MSGLFCCSAMKATILLQWGKLFLILSVLSCCSALQVTIQKQEYEVPKGEDVTLTCKFVPARPISNAFFLKWEASPDEIGESMKTVASFFLNNPIDVAPAYEGRATLEVDIDRQVSMLHLKKVTMQDCRSFQCSVSIPGDDEGNTADTTSLLVLEPPSAPVCKIQGTAEYWQDIVLTCMSEEGSPKPSYKWKGYSVESIPRPFPPKTTEKDGALSLFNISKEMSGFYICTSTNPYGSASCNLTLAVMPSSMNMGSTTIIIGVVAGVVVAAVIIFCCCRKKCKKDKQPEGSPEEVAYFDKNAPEAEEYADDKSKSKQQYKDEDKDDVPQSYYSVEKSAKKFEDDEHSNRSGRGRNDDKGSDADPQRYKEGRHNQYRGSQDHLNDRRDEHRGSQDHLNDRRDEHRGSRDHLNDRRDDYRGSRDHLNDRRDEYRGSQDRLGDRRDEYRGSRDRLEDRRDHYRGSQDRLEDRRDEYRGSRDRLEDRRDHYRGSQDRLDDRRDHYRGSRDHIEYIDDHDAGGYD